MTSEWTEKRRYPRARARRLVRYRIIHGGDPDRISAVRRGILVNIGGGGILLGVQELVSDGLHVSFQQEGDEQNWLALEIDLLPGRPPVRALGQVAWYQRATNALEYNFDVGVEFKEIREEDRKTVMDFVSREAPPGT